MHASRVPATHEAGTFYLRESKSFCRLDGDPENENPFHTRLDFPEQWLSLFCVGGGYDVGKISK
jgi:hypothetical protein